MDVIFKLNEIDKTAAELWKQNQQKKIWAFYGEMGAGKTTFISALCKLLNVKDSIGSPTFSIINEYKSADEEIIFHLDLYRVKDEEEALQAGVLECLTNDNFCFIEWPEKISELLPENVLNIYIEVIDETTRHIFTT